MCRRVRVKNTRGTAIEFNVGFKNARSIKRGYFCSK